MINLHRWLVQTGRTNCRLFNFVGVVPTHSYRGYSDKRPSIGIIVIGNEILKAQVKDTNSFYACSLLYKHGVKVAKISVVADDVREIASEMQQFSKRYTYVITSGGIGPTHDDVTYEALAVAFEDTMHYNQTLIDIIRNRFGCESSSSPAYKMAYVPKKVELRFGKNEMTGETLAYPCIALRNVYVFPGSPTYFRMSFKSLCKELFSGNKCFAADEVFLNAREELFANALTALAKEYPNVSFGSYPERNRYYKARVTIESDSREETEKARERFCKLTPQDVLVRYDREPQIDCLAKYEQFLRASERRAIYENTVEKLLEFYRNPAEVLIYLDGSVESIVLVHLARLAAAKLRLTNKLRAICFQSNDRPRGIERFVQNVAERYDLEAITLLSQGEVEQFIALKSELRTLLLGNRQSGPNNFTNTVKVNIKYPLMEWTNEDVNTFVNSLFLPYYALEEDRLQVSERGTSGKI